jgi:hypothetical protein
MPKLSVTAHLPHLHPTVLLEFSDDIPYLHTTKAIDWVYQTKNENRAPTPQGARTLFSMLGADLDSAERFSSSSDLKESDGADVCRLQPLGALVGFELNLLSFFQVAVART